MEQRARGWISNEPCWSRATSLLSTSLPKAIRFYMPVRSAFASAWQWRGDFTVGSGLYFTPRVLGGALDIGRGVSGSLRANMVAGQTIALSNPTALEWFNTAAFCAPGATCVNPSGAAFGDAGRNILEGRGQV